LNLLHREVLALEKSQKQRLDPSLKPTPHPDFGAATDPPPTR
jgi:hypothetical protein